MSIESGPSQTATLQDLAYDWDLAGNLSQTGPHAVTGIGSMTFGYDLNGNLTSRDGEAIGWTSFNKPNHIEHPSGDYADFTYGPDRSRYRQEASWDGWEPTVHYAGDVFEVVKWSESGFPARIDAHYIVADGRIVAQYTTSNAESPLLQYFHRDHLGSVVATTDDEGDVLARWAYDPFGARTLTSGDPYAVYTQKGYTGHEHLDVVEMIHMNGRVQDPVLGRFLSPDPIVQAPYYSQSLNRYSYVWNNPLSLTDPSGFQTRDPFDPTDLANCYAFPGACDSLDRYRQLEEWYNTTQYLLSLSRIGERGASEYRPGGPVTAEQICKGSCHGVDYSSHRYETDAERQQLYIIAGSAIVTAGTYGVVELVALTLGARYAISSGLLIQVYEVASNDAPVPTGIGSLGRGARAVPNATARGRASEARVLDDLGLDKNNRRVSTAEGNSVPDALTTDLSVEIKDAANVSLTRQLRIQTDAARAAGRDSVLITGERTCISARCAQAFDQVIRRPDLGPQ